MVGVLLSNITKNSIIWKYDFILYPVRSGLSPGWSFLHFIMILGFKRDLYWYCFLPVWVCIWLIWQLRPKLKTEAFTILQKIFLKTKSFNITLINIILRTCIRSHSEHWKGTPCIPFNAEEILQLNTSEIMTRKFTTNLLV